MKTINKLNSKISKNFHILQPFYEQHQVDCISNINAQKKYLTMKYTVS